MKIRTLYEQIFFYQLDYIKLIFVIKFAPLFNLYTVLALNVIMNGGWKGLEETNPKVQYISSYFLDMQLNEILRNYHCLFPINLPHSFELFIILSGILPRNIAAISQLLFPYIAIRKNVTNWIVHVMKAAIRLFCKVRRARQTRCALSYNCSPWYIMLMISMFGHLVTK